MLGYSEKYDYIVFQIDGDSFDYIPVSTHGIEIGDEVFDCYVSVINYCYIIYNNIWNHYEEKMERNEFGRFHLPL